MFFFNRKEVNYEYLYENTLKRVITNKYALKNKFSLSKKIDISLFFWFQKVKETELNFLKVFNFALFCWLIVDQVGKITKNAIIFERGIRFYRGKYKVKLKEKNFFKFFNFLIEIYLPLTQEKLSFHYLFPYTSMMLLKDFTMFTNFRLSNNLYLNSIQEHMYIDIENKSKKINLKVLLSLFKIRKENR